MPTRNPSGMGFRSTECQRTWQEGIGCAGQSDLLSLGTHHQWPASRLWRAGRACWLKRGLLCLGTGREWSSRLALTKAPAEDSGESKFSLRYLCCSEEKKKKKGKPGEQSWEARGQRPT